jgi:hypothetical protein
MRALRTISPVVATCTSGVTPRQCASWRPTPSMLGRRRRSRMSCAATARAQRAAGRGLLLRRRRTARWSRTQPLGPPLGLGLRATWLPVAGWPLATWLPMAGWPLATWLPVAGWPLATRRPVEHHMFRATEEQGRVDATLTVQRRLARAAFRSATGRVQDGAGRPREPARGTTQPPRGTRHVPRAARRRPSARVGVRRRGR